MQVPCNTALRHAQETRPAFPIPCPSLELNAMLTQRISVEIATDSVSDILKTISIPPCPAIVAALLEEAVRPEVD